MISRQLNPFVSLSGSCEAAPQVVPHRRCEGTVFRLALRTATTASQSNICNEFISDEYLTQIIHTFAASLPDLLLFLRHVTSVKIYFRAANHKTAMLHHKTAANLKTTFRQGSSIWLQQLLVITAQNINSDVSKKSWYKVVSAASHGAVLVLPLVLVLPC